MLPLLLTTRAAADRSFDVDGARHRADDEIGIRRAPHVQVPAAGGDEDRPVGLGDEAAALDRELDTRLGHDPDAAALADDSQSSHHNQPKPVPAI